MQKRLIIIFFLLLFAIFSFAQNSSIDQTVEIQGSGEVPSGGSAQFTEYFQIYFVANSMSVSKSGTDASKVDVTLDSWSQNTTTGYVTAHITIGVHSDVSPGSTLHFTIEYVYYFSGIGFYNTGWTINVTGTAGASADFEATPTTGFAPLAVQFTDKSTGDISNRAWEFGDGETSTATNPSHTYQNEGTYTVKLTVSGSGGSDSEIKTNYIVVNNNNIMSISDATKDENNDFIPDLLDQQVQIKGIVVSPNYGSSLQYQIQDATGGTMIYSYEFNSNLMLGDEVTVTGTVSQYRGKTEIVPPDANSVVINSQGQQLPDPLIIDIPDLGENIEGLIVEVQGVWLTNPSEWPIEGNDATVQITDGVNLATLFIDKDTYLDGWTPPSGVIDITGIADQFTYSEPPNDGYQIRLRYQSDIKVNTSIDRRTMQDANYELMQNYPNPFNAQTTIQFALPEQSEVSIVLYNIRGERVAEIFNGRKSAGLHSVTFNGDRLSSGTYLIKLKAGDFVDLKKCVLLK